MLWQKVLILLFLTISCIPIIAQSDYLFKNISSRGGRGRLP